MTIHFLRPGRFLIAFCAVISSCSSEFEWRAAAIARCSAVDMPPPPANGRVNDNNRVRMARDEAGLCSDAALGAAVGGREALNVEKYTEGASRDGAGANPSPAGIGTAK